DQRVGAEDVAARRIVAALTAADRADRVDDGKPRPPSESQRARRGPPVVLLLEEAHLSLAERHLVIDLVVIGHIVDESGADGVLWEERPVIDQRADLLLRLVAAVSEPANELPIEVGIERLGHLAMRRRE